MHTLEFILDKLCISNINHKRGESGSGKKGKL